MNTALLLLVIAVYLLPTWLSLYWNGWGRTSGFVYWINLLAGWTVVAWIVLISVAYHAGDEKEGQDDGHTV